MAAQFIGTDKIALFAFDLSPEGDAVILFEKHYVLVDPDEVSEENLNRSRKK